MKVLFITEKPSVAMEFARALNISGGRKDGYIESDNYIITWCVGHLITMSYPDKYNPAMKKWSADTLPFLPEPGQYIYEVIPETKKQYMTVKKLLNRQDINCIYYSGDSAREGEYIQRLVREMAGHRESTSEKRVWIDSQTEEEIRRGIQEAKPLSYYDFLSDSAYARAIEDYGVGINLSRIISILYGITVAQAAGKDRTAVAVGRVMSCVLGMVVQKERLIRANVKITYYNITAVICGNVECIWKPKEKSELYSNDQIYDMKGFLSLHVAESFIQLLGDKLKLEQADFSMSKKAAPLLYNLAELQGECTRRFHMGPDQTLAIVQSLYEKKMTTYPRTDARVLTTAVCAEIRPVISSLSVIPEFTDYTAAIIASGTWRKIAGTKYTDDSAVSDHYAIIPTGKVSAYSSLNGMEREIFFLICRRFLSIFYPPADFEKMSAEFTCRGEIFRCTGERILNPGWMAVTGRVPDTSAVALKMESVKHMSRGSEYPTVYQIKQEESQAPKRYTSGSMVLAMESAGKLIEDEELREQIRGTGIGTSATRAETIKKLLSNQYIQVDKKQVLSPTLLGESVFEIVNLCAPQMLSPAITASWEKGLAQIADGQTSKEEYLAKMYQFIRSTVTRIKSTSLKAAFMENMESNVFPFYKRINSKIKDEAESTQRTADKNFNCPVCGAALVYKNGVYYCTEKPDCSFTLWEKWCGKQLSDTAVKALLAGRRTAEIKGFKSRNGKSFSARLQLIDGKITPVWK